MDSKARFDYLTDESGRQVAYGGKSQKLNAISCSLLGIIILVCSFVLLRNERLQIQNYLNPSAFSRPFPAVLLGCAAANVPASVIQIISSLMFLFEDITIKIWNWAQFIVMMVSTLSVLLLSNEDCSDITLSKFYFISLAINVVICFLLIVSDWCCCFCCCGSRTPATRPY